MRMGHAMARTAEPDRLADLRADYDRAQRLATAMKLDANLRRGQAASARSYLAGLLEHGRLDDALDLGRELAELAARFPDEAFPRQCAAESCLALVQAHARAGDVETAHQIVETIAHFAFGHAGHAELQAILADAGLCLLHAYAERRMLEEARAVHVSLRNLAEAGTAGAILLLRRVQGSVRLVQLEAAAGAVDHARALQRELEQLALLHHHLPELGHAAEAAGRALAARPA